MGWLIIIGSVPIVVLGYFGRDIITNDLRSLWLIASVMIIFGVILGIADKYGKSERSLEQLSTKHGLLYGAGVLVGTLVNSLDQEDALLGVAINGQIASLTGSNVLAKNKPVIFEGPSANIKAVVPVLGAKAGQRVQVTMFFARAGEVTVQAIIRDQRDDYAGITA